MTSKAIPLPDMNATIGVILVGLAVTTWWRRYGALMRAISCYTAQPDFSYQVWVYLVEKKFVASGMTNLPWMSNAFVVIAVQSQQESAFNDSLGLASTLFIERLWSFIHLRKMASLLNTLSFMIESVNDDINLQVSDWLPWVLLLPAASIYVVFYYIGTHLYSVSLLSMLNAREGLRTRVSDDPYYTDTPTSRLTNLFQFRFGPRTRACARANSQRQLLQLWGQATSPRIPGIVVSIRRDTTIAFDDANWKDAEGSVYETYRTTPGGLGEEHAPTLVAGARPGEGEDTSSGDWVQVVDPARLRLTPSPFSR
ncbi:hypothetical protein C8Q79DRAFT_924541 [Trametes meyenii]|nr:hypothetical protein C8Q79DRAFT_924541 [Trametes meyenii]